MPTATLIEQKQSRGKNPTGAWGDLVRRRQAQGHTQDIAAREIGVSQPTLSDWETCRTYPRIEHIRALSRYMGLPMAAVWQMILENFLSQGISESDIKSEKLI